MNRPEDEENWTETSTSAMFTFTVAQALNKGWLKDEDGTFAKLVKTGLQGVKDQVVANGEYTDVLEIVIGTGVGDKQWYYDRPRKTNDLHGLGAVLIMLEYVEHDKEFIIPKLE